MRRELDALAAAASTACGAAWGSVHPGIGRPLPIGVLALVAAGARRRARWPFVVLGLALVAAGLGARAAHGLEMPPSVHGVGVMTGAVVGDPVASTFSTIVVVRAERWRRAPSGAIAVHRRLLVRAGPDDRSRFVALGSGDRIAVRGRVVPLTGWERRWRFRHVAAAVDDARLIGLAAPDTPLAGFAERVRAVIAGAGSGLPSRERGLLAAFLLGDARGLPDDVVDRFRRAGMSHLLVVSGANVAAVLALLGPILRRAPIALRVVLAAPALAVFGAATRWEPSVLRAVAMALVVLVAAALGRPTSGLRVLALAVIGLLLADPFLVRSVGFGLSVGATAGIAVLAPWFAARIPGPRSIATSIAVTTAAQIGVAPILVPVFGAVPLVALPANVVAAPLVVPVTAWGLASGGVAAIAGDRVAGSVQWPNVVALRVIGAIARVASAHPCPLRWPAIAEAILATGAAGVAARWWRARDGVAVRMRR